MNPEMQSESCSMVLVVLGCVQAYFRVPFTCPRIERPGSPFRKASANVQECPGLSRRLLKCARSFTPPLEHRPIVDPDPAVPPTLVSENKEPPTPMAVSLPPETFLSADSTVHTPPPLAMPAQPPVYTVLPPTVPTMMSAPAPTHTVEPFPFQTSQPHMGLSYQAPLPLNIPPLELGTLIRAALAAPLINFLPKTETEPERRLKKMEETIRALQAGSSRFDYNDSD
ncbi:hypothetical protein CRG98_007618 [Punica granatum]|uniref:Uncharacterized protein n=1 Tax=Punica granatum TaxID=22663 RepID=A0A2I0KU57_PUNGR|nr:hypothetical protein CRG98_007618 [Punica granatum]